MNNLFPPIWTSELWKPVWGDAISIWPNDLAAMQRLFSNGELGGYWPADPEYSFEDSAGALAASVNGVCGLRFDVSNGTAVAVRRNLLTYTEQFDHAAWTKSNTTITPNAAIAPDGTLTADKSIDNIQTGEHYIEQTIATASNQSYAYTIYVKGGETSTFVLYVVCVGASSATGAANFTVVNGVVAYSNNTLGIINSVSVTPDREGFYKIKIIYTLNGTVTSHRFRINAKQSASYAGDGTSGLYIWGAQLEVGADATPYQKIITGAADCLPGNHAIQQTTANKPYLRVTPTSNKPWYDSNTATGAMNVTFASALGSSCTIATVTPEGVSILESQTVGTTYNICPPFGYNSDVLIINRALTAAERALVTRVMQRSVPTLGSELVTNGGFDTDIVGYNNGTLARGSISWDSGRLKMDATAGNGIAMYAYTPCAASAGVPYCVKYAYSSINGGVSYLNLGEALTNSFPFSNKTLLSAIIPTTGAVSISLYSAAYTTGYVDNVSVKAIL